MDSKLLSVNLGSDFFGSDSKCNRTTINQGSYQTKKLEHSKRNDQKKKKKIFVNNKALISKMYFKKFIQLNSQKANNPIKNG